MSWKGNLGIVQFIHIEIFGIKAYILYESEFGYIWNMTVYCGKATELKGNDNLGLASKVVMTFSEELGKGYTAYVDNFCLSLELSLSLKDRLTFV